MHPPRICLTLCSSILVLGVVVHQPMPCHATEIISVVCGTIVTDGPNSAVVPVTISMSSGSADYIDMTYSAVDSQGGAPTCTPATHRVRVSRTSPVTDNVTVTGNATNLNFSFTAYGTGEAPGGDQTSGGVEITQLGRGPHRPARPDDRRRTFTTVTPAIADLSRQIKQLVPIKLHTDLPHDPTNPQPNVTLSYRAWYTPAGGAQTFLTTISPTTESKIHVLGAETTPPRPALDAQVNAVVDVTAAGTNTVTFEVTAAHLPSETTNLVVTYQLGNATAASGNTTDNHYVLTVGPSERTAFFKEKVTVATDTAANVKYSAVFQQGGFVTPDPDNIKTFLEVSPRHSLIEGTNDADIVDILCRGDLQPNTKIILKVHGHTDSQLVDGDNSATPLPAN
jgi:hypothetical protein